MIGSLSILPFPIEAIAPPPPPPQIPKAAAKKKATTTQPHTILRRQTPADVCPAEPTPPPPPPPPRSSLPKVTDEPAETNALGPMLSPLLSPSLSQQTLSPQTLSPQTLPEAYVHLQRTDDLCAQEMHIIALGSVVITIVLLSVLLTAALR